MVTTSGFHNAPVSLLLILALLSTSLLVSILQLKHLLPIKPTPHLWPYLQFWRLLSFQTTYISSTELLFSIVLIYQFRTLERLWGSRKYASFLAVLYIICGCLTVVSGLALKISTLGVWGYIPPGLTGVVWATCAVWRKEVPMLGGVKIMTGSEGPGAEAEGALVAPAVLLSDKVTMYVLAAQLALSQFPYQLVPAVVGWVVGSAWREELVPTGLIRWRVPAWMVGGEGGLGKAGRQYEGLRRRLEEEGGSADGMREVSDGVVRGDGQQEERRGLVRGLMGYFGGGGGS